MKGTELKLTLMVFSFVIFVIFMVPDYLACGPLGGYCQSELAQEVRNFTWPISFPALVIFGLILFLPLRLFGSTKKNVINDPINRFKISRIDE